MRTKVSSIVYDLQNVRVLLYNGQDDFIINTYSAFKWINNMQWSGIPEFQNAERQIWTLKSDNTTIVGKAQNAGNLWWAVVYKAGHMVPTD